MAEVYSTRTIILWLEHVPFLQICSPLAIPTGAPFPITKVTTVQPITDGSGNDDEEDWASVPYLSDLTPSLPSVQDDLL